MISDASVPLGLATGYEPYSDEGLATGYEPYSDEGGGSEEEEEAEP